VGVAALITLDASGRCERARIALCGVGPTPIRARAAEDALLGGTPGGAALAGGAAPRGGGRRGGGRTRAAAATSPPSDVHGSADFRRKLARHFTREAIAMAAQRASRSCAMPTTGT